MLKNWRPPRMSQIIRLVSPGAFPSTMTSVGLTAVASAMSPDPTATRWIGCAVSTRTALPTATESSLVESSNVAPADGGVDGAALSAARPARAKRSDSALQDTMVTPAFVLNAVPRVKKISLQWIWIR